jgi:cob(I)alamin adenosyltransferase
MALMCRMYQQLFDLNGELIMEHTKVYICCMIRSIGCTSSTTLGLMRRMYQQLFDFNRELIVEHTKVYTCCIRYVV